MKRVSMFGSVAALALMMVLAVANLGWAKQQVLLNVAGGTITGTVVDADGKAVSGAEVRLVAPAPTEKTPKKNAKTPPAGKNEPIKTAKTDADGKFSMAEVPAGDYSIGVRVKNVGNAKSKVTVTEGQETTVALKLVAKKAKN